MPATSPSTLTVDNNNIIRKKSLHRTCAALDILDQIIVSASSARYNSSISSTKSGQPANKLTTTTRTSSTKSSGKKSKKSSHQKTMKKSKKNKTVSGGTAADDDAAAAVFVGDILKMCSKKEVMVATWERLPDNSTAVLKDRRANAGKATDSNSGSCSTASITSTTSSSCTSSNTMSSDLSGLSDMVTTLMSKLDQQTLLAKERRQTVSDLKFERAVLGRKQLKLKQELAMKQEELTRAQATVEQLQLQRDQDQALIDQLQAQLAHGKVVVDSQAVLELQRQLQDLQARHQHLQERLRSATREHDLASVKHASERVLASLKSKSSRSLVVQNTNKSSSVNATTDEQLADKCMQLWALQTDHQKLQQEHQAQTDYVQQLEQALNNSNTANGDISVVSTTNVYQQLQAAQHALSALDADHQAERMRTRMLTAQLEEMQAECDNLRTRMARMAQLGSGSPAKNFTGSTTRGDDVSVAGTILTCDDSVSTTMMQDISTLTNNDSFSWTPPTPLYSRRPASKKTGWTAPTPLWESA